MIESPGASAAGRTGLLINSEARRASHVEALPQLLATHGIEVGPIARVKHSGDLRPEIDRLLAEGLSRLIVGGGDGTLSLAAARLAHRNVTLGVLPLGTANDFARTLGIPADPNAAAQVIADGHVRLIDLGLANGIPFLNVASIGMSVSATSELSIGIKRRLGLFAYLYAAARVFTRNSTFRIRVEDGVNSIETTAHQLVVGNGRYYGGGVLVARQSSLEDGLLHAYVLGSRGRWELLRTVALLRMGIPLDRPGDCFLQTPELRVETWPSLDVGCDGEIRTNSPVNFKVEPKALRVLVPQTPS